MRQVAGDHEIDPGVLVVPRCSIRSLALGTVLRGAAGIGQMVRLVPEEPLTAGCALWILQDISATVLSTSDELSFAE